MFTGIVEEVGKVISAGAGNLSIAADGVLEGMEKGDSMAVNGVCLTVTSFDDKSFSADVMPETMDKTNLGLLRPGDGVNLERPLAANGRLGGHLVQGHIDDRGRVSSVSRRGEARLLSFDVPPKLMPYIVEKGFIAVDGVSLTVVSRDSRSFQVSVVGYTREHTTLGSRGVGEVVNLEVDIIAKYVEQLSKPHSGGITIDFLQEHGFLVG
ncbi:MAG: riboflavin synthase subunit alpha [Chloroflexi bacterium RBG_13_56_8b]|nr:MAG: riboflavin synthase subunit alpha [Chloroflexi bacterium RBG_13_56_8b]